MKLQRGSTLVVASHNPGKVREITELLAPFGIVTKGAAELGLPEPEETETTFAGNAALKARAATKASGLAALADDSGLAVAALDGAPGIYSARYAGEGASDEDNLEKLVREVDAAGGERRAAYVCVLALVDEDGTEHVFEATCEGTLLRERRGSGGFGYDPIFLPDETGPGDERTMSELSQAEKNAISHRGRAARLLLAHLGA